MNAYDYILNIPMWTKKKNSFEAIKKFLDRLGNPQLDFKIVHVAGTNGKGSVCAYLTSILCESGYAAGTFISPHLENIRERFMINFVPVSEELFEYAYEQVYRLSQDMLSAGYEHPSYFEFLFYMSWVIFKKSNVEYVIMETGLGGMHDTTNAVDNQILSVITSISMDHMQYLGNDLSSIARQKAGIIKPRVAVVYDDNTPLVSDILSECADKNNSKRYPVKSLPYIENAMSGYAQYQIEDASLAAKAAELLEPAQITRDIIIRGILKTNWPGRMERIGDNIYLDGAHNEGGIKAFIKAAKGKKHIHLLFAAVSDKEYETMIKLLSEELRPEYVTVAHINSSRAADDTALSDIFKKYTECRVTACDSVESALEDALEHKKDEDILYCLGSLYLIGEIKMYWRKKHDKF